MLAATVIFQYNGKAKSVDVPAKFTVYTAAKMASIHLNIPLKLKEMKFQIEGEAINPMLSVAFYADKLLKGRGIIKLTPIKPLADILKELMQKLTSQEMLALSDMLAEKSAVKANKENIDSETNQVVLHLLPELQ